MSFLKIIIFLLKKKDVKLNNDSWRVNKTYIKVKGKYLYRAVVSDKSGANIAAFKEIIKDNFDVLKNIEIRQNKYLNNIIEQDHRFIKRIVRPMLGFKSFNFAKQIISGIETMNILRKEQVEGKCFKIN